MPDYVFVVRVCTYCHLGLCGFGSLWILVSLFDPPYWLRLGLCALYWMKGSLYMKLCQIETLVVSQCIECSLFEYLLLFIVSLKIHRSCCECWTNFTFGILSYYIFLLLNYWMTVTKKRKRLCAFVYLYATINECAGCPTTNGYCSVESQFGRTKISAFWSVRDNCWQLHQ